MPVNSFLKFNKGRMIRSISNSNYGPLCQNKCPLEQFEEDKRPGGGDKQGELQGLALLTLLGWAFAKYS